MRVNFKEEELRELYETGETKSRKYKKVCKSKKLVEGYIRAVSIMREVESSVELKEFSFLHYERLRHQGNEPKISVRLTNGMVERLIFTEKSDGIEVELIEIDTTHYGRKRR